MIQRITSIALFLFLILGDVISQTGKEYAYHINGQNSSRQITIKENSEVALLVDAMFDNNILNTSNDSIISKTAGPARIISDYISDGSRYAMKDFLSWDIYLSGIGNSILDKNNFKNSIYFCDCGPNSPLGSAESIIYLDKGIYGIEKANGSNISLYDTLTKSIKQIDITNGAFMQNTKGESYYINAKNLFKYDVQSSQFVKQNKIVSGLDSMASFKGNINYHPKSDHYYIYKTSNNATQIYIFSINKDSIHGKTIDLASRATSLVVEDDNVIWLSADLKSLHWYNEVTKKDSISYTESSNNIKLNKLYRKNNKTYVLGGNVFEINNSLFGFYESLAYPLVQEHVDGEKFTPYRNDLSLTIKNERAEIVGPINFGYYIKTDFIATIKNNSSKPVNKFNILSRAFTGPTDNYIYNKTILPGESIDVEFTQSNFTSYKVPFVLKSYTLGGGDNLVDKNSSNNVSESRLSVPVTEINFDKNITITPNPSQDFITIDSELPISSVKIFDKTGKQVIESLSGEKIDIATLRQGLYLVNIISQGQSYTKRFIKI
jgi:hypothetical protein